MNVRNQIRNQIRAPQARIFYQGVNFSAGRVCPAMRSCVFMLAFPSIHPEISLDEQPSIRSLTLFNRVLQTASPLVAAADHLDNDIAQQETPNDTSQRNRHGKRSDSAGWPRALLAHAVVRAGRGLARAGASLLPVPETRGGALRAAGARGWEESGDSKPARAAVRRGGRIPSPSGLSEGHARDVLRASPGRPRVLQCRERRHYGTGGRALAQRGGRRGCRVATRAAGRGVWSWLCGLRARRMGRMEDDDGPSGLEERRGK